MIVCTEGKQPTDYAHTHLEQMERLVGEAYGRSFVAWCLEHAESRDVVGVDRKVWMRPEDGV